MSKSNFISFPIKQDPACYLKWSWSTVFLNKGTTASCHRTMHLPLTVDNFSEFHNLPKKIDDRERMLRGEWPRETTNNSLNSGLSGCNYCQKIEQSGGRSDRIHQTETQRQLPFFQSIPPELIDNPTATKVSPTILEVYFSNTCNMSCLYCGPHFSSQWHEENRRFNMMEEDGVMVNPSWRPSNVDYFGLRDELFKWLEKNSRSLWNFGMLGGEPFVQDEFEMMLDHFDQYPNPDLMFTMTTNLKIPYEKLVKHMERIKRMCSEGKMKYFNISASMDCGDDATMEYVRWGLNMEKWRKNFEYLVQQDDWLIINLNFTITPLTIKSLDKLLDQINRWDWQRAVKRLGEDGAKNLLNTHEDYGKHLTFSFMHCVEPAQLDPTYWDPEVFREDFEKILKIIPQRTNYQKSMRDYMEGIWKKIQQQPVVPEKILLLKTYLTEIDRRRNLNWCETFPWLEEVFKKYA